VTEESVPQEPVPAVLTPEELERLPPEVRVKIEGLIEHRFEMIRNPLLPPDVLARYDNVVPGFAERLLKWTEDEAEHRRGLERESMLASISFRSRGQWFGTSVSIVGLIAAGIALALTNSTAGMLGTSVIAIVAVGGPFAARILASRWARSSPNSGQSEER
jgi:uncharacterized membrane protein